jgi:hypothetical protein
MPIKISSHTGFQPLKTCLVGRCYPPEFFDKIENPEVRSVMRRIAEETEEDYLALIAILEKFGVTVVRPTINADNNFEEYMLIRADGTRVYQKPPMQPRDDLLVIGNKIFSTRPHGPQYVDFYDAIWNDIEGEKFHAREHPALKGMCAPGITRVGHDVYFDEPVFPEYITKYFEPHYRCHHVNTGGHSDAVFCPVTPGLIVSLRDYQEYEKTFPGWEVVYLPNQSWDLVRPFLELKEKNQGRWWIPGEEKNDSVTEYIDTWLGHWVGYVEETVFDVNMLVIDEHNVVCNNYNEKVFEALARHGVTPHVCNFRHRFFWDGGLHCNTLDLVREGSQIDYFPTQFNN